MKCGITAVCDMPPYRLFCMHQLRTNCLLNVKSRKTVTCCLSVSELCSSCCDREKLKCQSDILQCVNNLLLLYDSAIQSKRSFLTCNGLLLQRYMQKDVKHMKEVMKEELQVQREIRRHELLAMKVRPLTHSVIKHNLTLLSLDICFVTRTVLIYAGDRRTFFA